MRLPPRWSETPMIALLRDLFADTRHAFRQFRRQPGYSVLGIGTLALGLGATIALGSVVRSVMLQPLPVTDEMDLRVFWDQYDWRGVEFDFLTERARALRLAAYSLDMVSLRTEEGSTAEEAGIASANLFDVLGAPPLLGRTFAPGEDRPGAEPVVVLSHGLWQRTFTSDSTVIGRHIMVDGNPARVVGVMPPTFFFPTPTTRLWRPLLLDQASSSYQNNGWLVILARKAHGSAERLVTDEVASLGRALGERFDYPAAWDKSKSPGSIPLRTYLVGDLGPGLLLLLSAGVLILLMACANVAALMLARTTDRANEMRLRAALGAGRARLARQIIAESFALSALAGVVGAVVARLGFAVLVAALPLPNGLATIVTLDWKAYLLAFGLALVVALTVSAVPARDLLRGGLAGVGSSRRARGVGHRTGRAHGVLVASEAAIAVLLLVGAGLMIRSVERLYAIDLGFDVEGRAAIDLFAGGDELSPVARRRFFDAIVDQSAALPDVTGAALVLRLPVRDGGWQGSVEIEDNPDLQGKTAPNSLFRPVTPDYFRTLGIAVTRGRGFTLADRTGSPLVAVVSESFAAKAWPDTDPIGRRIRGSFGTGDSAMTVVGVVAEIKITSITGANEPVLYVPLAQRPGPTEGAVLVVTSRNRHSLEVVPSIRHLVNRLEPRIAIGRVTDLESVVAGALAEPLRLRFFLVLFASLALVLGVAGIYSVVSYAVTSRRSEYGVRLALGATGGQVLRRVIHRGLRPVAAGTGIGLLSAWALSRVAARFLYGISPTDPVSSLVAVVAVLLAGIAASVVPGWRATRVSPSELLRSE